MKDDQHLRFDRTLSEEKRVVTGSYYTPPAMAELMVLLALSFTLHKKIGKYRPEDFLQCLRESSVEPCLLKTPLEQLQLTEQIHGVLSGLEVLDLSAGSGVFPLTYMQVLKSWFSAFGLWQQPLIRKMLKKLTVIDIQPEPLSLYTQEVAALYGVKPETLPVYCLDALDESGVSKHLKLENKLTAGMDLVLGNPPYLGEKNHKAIFQKMRATPFGARYYEGRMDYFYYFVYKGLEALKPGGQLCYITTNYFATADGAKNLRAHLGQSGKFNALVNFNDCALFKDALGQHNVVFCYEKQSRQEENKCLLAYPKHRSADLEALYQSLLDSSSASQEHWELTKVDSAELYDYQGMLKMVPGETHQELIEKLRHGKQETRKTLGELFFVQQGIVSGFDRDFKEKEGVFVLTHEEAKERPWLQPYLKPFYKNKQVRKYNIVKPTAYEVLYLSEKMEDLEQEQGPLYEHLQPHRERLTARREVQKKIRPWYALQWPREPWRFEGPLIAAPQRAFVNVFAYEADELYGSADIYYIADRMKDQWVRERTLWTLGYLNSPLVYFWLSLMGKRKGSMLELYASPLKAIPVPNYEPENKAHQLLVSQVEAVLKLDSRAATAINDREALLTSIHDQFYSLFELSASERLHIQTYYQKTGAEAAESHYWP